MNTQRFLETKRSAMRRTSAHVVPALIALLTLTGCVSHRPVTTAEINPRTELHLQFATPRAITFTSTGGDVVTHEAVTQLQGRMVTLDADSITLRVTSAERGDGWQQFGPGTSARFALTDVRLQEVQKRPGRTIALVTFAALGLILLIAIATYEEPPPPPPPEPKTKA
jgi:hypothetical protein